MGVCQHRAQQPIATATVREPDEEAALPATTVTVSEPDEEAEPPPTQAYLLAKANWRLAVNRAKVLLRLRKRWASLGHYLQRFAAAFTHLERRQGLLIHKRRRAP
jgi:hypothetical protein